MNVFGLAYFMGFFFFFLKERSDYFMKIVNIQACLVLRSVWPLFCKKRTVFKPADFKLFINYGPVLSSRMLKCGFVFWLFFYLFWLPKIESSGSCKKSVLGISVSLNNRFWWSKLTIMYYRKVCEFG